MQIMGTLTQGPISGPSRSGFAQREQGRRVVVAHVNGTFGGGGAERAGYMLALATQSAGLTSMCIAVKELGGYAQSESRMKTFALHANQGGKLGALKAMWRLRQLIRDHGIDVIHIHGTNALPFVALATWGMRRRPHILLTWHNTECVVDEKGFYRKVMIWALHQCTGITSSAREVSRRLKEVAHLAQPPELFRAGIEDPLDDGAVPQSHKADDEIPTILWMARMVPSKDPHTLIQAAGNLHKEGLKFRVILAGDAPKGYEWCGNDCKRLIKELDLEGIVSMPGWVSDTRPLLRSCSIGVQTSLFEAFSLTTQEQMMAGMAVVASNVGDTTRGVFHEKTGLLFEQKDVTVLTAHLRRVITDRELRKHLGAAARQYTLANCTVGHSAQVTLSQYRRMMPDLNWPPESGMV